MMNKTPDTIRTSLAAAMTLKLKPGRFYRSARCGCINLLLEYPEGCSANCAYCGLASGRPGRYTSKSFIRVTWPVYPVETILKQLKKYQAKLGRVCISMVTHPDAVRDTLSLTRLIRTSVNLPVSLLICPTILQVEHLRQFKEAGADYLGIAIDAATEALFDHHRGHHVHGPHRWKTYWSCFRDAVEIFGFYHVGSHLMAGLGETERELVEAIQMTRDAGGFTHLFSFYPESESALADHEPPPLDSYRRIQLARYLIDNGTVGSDSLVYDENHQITSFGISENKLTEIVQTGLPFETSGCPDNTGKVACNRPFANSLPGDNVRNLPYKASSEDIERILASLGLIVKS